MTEAKTTPRPTGKNSEQDAEIAALKAQVEMLTKKIEAGAAAPKRVIAALPPEEARKQVLAAFSDTPKTYLALQDGTDFNQGFIKEGTIFTTTQPQGSWMELIEDAPSAE